MFTTVSFKFMYLLVIGKIGIWMCFLHNHKEAWITSPLTLSPHGLSINGCLLFSRMTMLNPQQSTGLWGAQEKWAEDGKLHSNLVQCLISGNVHLKYNIHTWKI